MLASRTRYEAFSSAVCAVDACRATPRRAPSATGAATPPNTPSPKSHEHPKQVYVNEQAIVDELDRWLSSLFDTEHLDQTCEQLAAASATPDDGDTARREIAQRKVADCDTRLSRYRAALDSGADPAVVTTWIAEAQGEKLAAQETLAIAPRQSSTPAEIRELIAGLTDVTKALKDADGQAKAEVYSALGLHLTYRPNQRQVDVIAAPKAVDVSACRRGDLSAGATRFDSLERCRWRRSRLPLRGSISVLPERRCAIDLAGYRPGSIRLIVFTRSMDRSKEATASTPDRSALATR